MQLSDRAEDQAVARRRYLRGCLLLYCAGWSAGMLVALAEHLSWLPPLVTSIFALPSCSSPTSMIGLAMGRTMAVPLLFLFGLFPVSYHFCARWISFFFWLFQGCAFWQVCYALSGDSAKAVPVLLCILALSVCMAWRMLRIHAITAGGPGIPSKRHPHPKRAYLYELLVAWGELLILQGGADWIVSRLLR